MGRTILDVWVLLPAGGRVAIVACRGLERDPDERLLSHVVRAVRDRTGAMAPALELFVPDAPAGGGPVPVLLVLEGIDGPDLSVSGPSDVSAVPEVLRGRATMWIEELTGRQPPPSLRPPWARPGWTARVTAWLDRQLAWADRSRLGDPEQQRAWSLSWLARAETRAGAVWLKACMPRFHAEPALGGWLAAQVPSAVPGVVAVDAPDRLLLLEEMDGGTAKDAGGEDAAPEAPAVLAGIARASEAHVGELRALGLHDRPLGRIPALLRPVLLGPAPVVDPGLAPERAAAIIAWVERQVTDLERLGLPPALVHGDFHAGNVAWDRGRLVVFDWSDAVVGHPLMDAAAWLWEAPDAAAAEARWEAWVDAWTPRVPARLLRPRRDPVLGVGAAHQLLSLDGILRAMEPETRHSLAWSAAAYVGVLDRLVPR